MCNEHPCTFCGSDHKTTTPPPLLFLSSLTLQSHFAVRSWEGKIFCCKSRYCVCHYLNMFLLIWSQAYKAVREMASNCQHAKPSSFKSFIYLELKNDRHVRLSPQASKPRGTWKAVLYHVYTEFFRAFTVQRWLRKKWSLPSKTPSTARFVWIV